MKQKILAITALASFAIGFSNCKPRRSDSGLSSEQESEKRKALDTAFATSMRIKLRKEPSSHFADDSASKILNELNKNAKESPHSVVRYQSASAVADITAVGPPWTIVEKGKAQAKPGFDPKVPTSSFVAEAIKHFKLKTPIGRACRSDRNSQNGPATDYKFQICSNFLECSQAITLLTSFTRRDWGDYIVESEIKKKNELIARDIQRIGCTDGEITKKMLEHKHESMKIWQAFNRGTGIEEPGNAGMQVSMDPKDLQQLKARLDRLIASTENDLLHKNVDRAAPVSLVKRYILNEIMSPAIFQDLSKQSNLNEINTDANSRDQFAEVWAKLEPQQQDTMLAYLETTYGSTLDTHDSNVRLRIYLDRVNKKSIRPWIACLNNRVDSYIEQFDSTKPNLIIKRVLPSDNPNDTSCIGRAIKPNVAFRTITMFLRQEMVLPERRFYFTDGVELLGRKVLNNTSGIWKPIDAQSGFDPVSQATQTAADLLNFTNSNNAKMYNTLHERLPDFFPPYNVSIKEGGDPEDAAFVTSQLKVFDPTMSRHPILGSDTNRVSYEQRIAKNLRGYHSLNYQLSRYSDKMQSLNRNHTIQRCIIGDLGLRDEDKQVCADAGRFNLEDKDHGVAQKKKSDGSWVDFTDEEKRSAFKKMGDLEQEMTLQAAVQGCAAKEFGSPQSFPDKMRLNQREKAIYDKVPDWAGINPYGCWNNVVYNLNTRHLVHALFLPSSLMRSSGSGPEIKYSNFGHAPRPGELKLPVDYAADTVESVFKYFGGDELTRSTNTDAFFKEIPFKPALDGYFATKDICLSKGLKGQMDPSMFNYYNSVNRWLTSQKMWDKCQELTIEIVNLILSTVTMPMIGKATHMIIGRLLLKSPSVLVAVGRTHRGILAAAKEGRWALTKFLASNPAALRLAAWQIMKNMPYTMWNLGWNVAVFTALNKALYWGLQLQDFYDPKRGVWDNIGHEMVMGAWFMGGMPALHKFSRILFPGPISKFMGQGSAAAMTNFTAGVALEATFFRYIGPIAEWVTEETMHKYHKIVYGEDPPEKPDLSWQNDKGELYEWGHAVMMTLVFKVGRDPMRQSKQELYDAHMARVKRRYYKARNQLGLKTFDPYKKETSLAQNAYSDLFIDLAKVNVRNQAEVARIAEAQYKKLEKGEIKGPQGQNLAEGVKQGDPYAMQVMSHAAHALETLRNPGSKKAHDALLKRSLSGDMKFEGLSDGSGSVYSNSMQHYTILGLEYQGQGPLNRGMLNGKYQQARRKILEEIRREESNMTRNKGKNDPRRKPFQERIADLKEKLKNVDASFKLLSNPRSKSEIDQIIEDPRMAQAVQGRIDDLEQDDAYRID